MLGSYPPQEQPHEVVWPRHGWEEAPSGMLARGSYKSTIKFIDDDDHTHLQFDYGFSIKKDWGKDKDKEYVFSANGFKSHFRPSLPPSPLCHHHFSNPNPSFADSLLQRGRLNAQAKGQARHFFLFRTRAPLYTTPAVLLE